MVSTGQRLDIFHNDFAVFSPLCASLLINSWYFPRFLPIRWLYSMCSRIASSVVNPVPSAGPAGAVQSPRPGPTGRYCRCGLSAENRV